LRKIKAESSGCLDQYLKAGFGFVTASYTHSFLCRRRWRQHHPEQTACDGAKAEIDLEDFSVSYPDVIAIRLAKGANRRYHYALCALQTKISGVLPEQQKKQCREKTET
jgi:hypothetical protein